MTLWVTTVIGILAACGTTASWLPQAWKTIRTREAGDFSWGYLALFSAGTMLWATYGALRRDPAVLGANLVTFVLILPVIYVKVRS